MNSCKTVPVQADVGLASPKNYKVPGEGDFNFRFKKHLDPRVKQPLHL